MEIELNPHSSIDSAEMLIRAALSSRDLHPQARDLIARDGNALNGIVEELALRLDFLDLGKKDMGSIIVNPWNTRINRGLQSITLQVLRPKQEGTGYNEVLLPESFAPAELTARGGTWTEEKSPTIGVMADDLIDEVTGMASVQFPIEIGHAEYVTGKSDNLLMDNRKSGQIKPLHREASLLTVGADAVRTYAQINKRTQGVSPEDIRDVIHQGIYACQFWKRQEG